MENIEINVLLVEDNPGDARLIIEMLKESRQMTCTATVAENLSDAITSLDKYKFDVIILDLNLPDSAGLATLDLIIKSATILLPVIVMTGLNDEYTGIAAIERGAEDYLVKGETNPAQMIRSIRYALERKKIEVELRESREIFRKFMDNSPIYVFFKDDHIRSLMLSKNYEALLGKPLDELLGKTMDELFPSDFAKKMIADDLRILNEGKEVSIEEEFNGRFYETIKFPIQHMGKPKYLAGYTIDTTERKLAEAEILNGNIFLDSIIKQSPNPIWISDNKGTLIRLNKACCNMLKITPEEVIGKYNIFEDNIVKDLGMMPLVRSVYEEGKSVNFDISYDTAQLTSVVLEKSSYSFINVTIFPIRDNTGKITNAVIQHLDITERILAERSLRESEEKFRLLVENSYDIIYTLNSDGVFDFVSPSWTTLLGHPVDQVSGHSFQEFVHPDDIPVCIIFLQSVVETGQRQTGVEYRVQHMNGKWYWHTSSAVSLKDEAGTITGFYAIARDITESRRAEKAIRESEEKYRTLIEATPCIICKIKPDGTTVFVNDYIKFLTGYTAEELTGRNWWDVFYPGDMHWQVEKILLKLRSGDVNGYEMSLVTKDGSVKIIQWRSFNKYGAYTELIEINGVGVDITERKRDEQELILRSTAMDNAANAIIITDRTGAIEYVNPAFENITGYTPKDALGKNPSELIKSGYHDRSFYKELWDKITSGKVWTGEIINKRKDGSLYTEDMTIAPVKKADGTIQNYIAIKQDITEKKFAAELLNVRIDLINYSENHSLDDLIIKTLDDVEKLTSSSISFFHFLNEDQKTLSLQAWSTQTSRDFCKAEGKGLHYNIEKAGVWVDCVRERKAVIHNDYMSLPHRKGLPEGHAPVIRELVIPIIRNDMIKAILGVGNKTADYNKTDISVINYLADIVWDIIERKRAEENLIQLNADLETRVAIRTTELEKANKELEAFSYSVSHDLRAPVRHISGFLEMLKRETGDTASEKSNHYMEVISDSAKRMNMLIDDLLSFSRMRRASLSRQFVNMGALADDVLNEFSDELNRHKIAVLKKELPSVQGDAAMLRVVIVNLISNAIKFSAKVSNPSVEIGTDIVNGEQVYYVRDNGAGFDMKYSDKLFGVFQRLHNERDFEGTGIGLAMIKNIIERHNGRVWAEGEPGKGACFYFTLPVERERENDFPEQ